MEGMGIYEQARLDNGRSFWLPRLQQIAAGGFKFVLNYDLLYGAITDILDYIQAAYELSMKVIVALHDPILLNGQNFGTKYSQLVEDWGGDPTDGAGLCAYVASRTSTVPGTWGFYVFDEPMNSSHLSYKVNTDAVKAASPLPRLGIEGGTGGNSCWQNISQYFDCCDVCGDDWYVLSYTAANNLGWVLSFTSQVAQGIQTYADNHGLQSAIVLQAFNQNEYSSPVCAPWPMCAKFPDYLYMSKSRELALGNMNPRIVLWYSYFDIMRSDNPALHWNELCMAANGVQVGWV